mgnify:CR=1 FL=1
MYEWPIPMQGLFADVHELLESEEVCAVLSNRARGMGITMSLSYTGGVVAPIERKGMVCFSGGKDSTAMLLRMLELDDDENYPVNRIVFSDTEFEFPELYEYLDRIQVYLDENYPERGLKIERIHAKKSWNDWFYGKVTSGKMKGKQRGAPLKVYPCWWSREAKVYPLRRVAKEMNADFQYVGIAFDERHRERSDEKLRYPLIEWKWTEEDALAYLDHLDLGLSLYTAFNRLGCFHCIKQPASSWYQLWKKWPDLWEISKHWDEESLRISDRPLAMTRSLDEMEKRFEGGWIPESKAKYDCLSCDAVAFTATGVMEDDDFETDQAMERDSRWKSSSMLKEMRDEEEDEWIPPSHLRGENVCAPTYDTWFCD